VIYTIKPGDNLLAIAQRFNVDVAALQEVNGILDPRSLQIGQQLIIPRPEEFEQSIAPTATPTPLPITVQNVHFNDTAIGGLWVLVRECRERA
jgi:LysM repeat protein